MRIEFTQCYAEVNTSFDFPSSSLILLRDELNRLGKSIAQFENRFKGNDFKLTFYISASRKISEVEVKGPSIGRKTCWVEFVIYIPYTETTSSTDIVYALRQVGRGIVMTLNRYQISAEGVEAVVENVIRQVGQNDLINENMENERAKDL